MWFFYDSEGTRVGLVNNGYVYYYIYNLQGDVLAIARAATGEIVAKYSYDAWGNCTVTNAANYTVGTKNPFRYRGYYYDVESGLYYLNSRYYSPEFGRFISPDIYVNTGQGLQSANMYVYCENDPVDRYDSDGGFSFIVASGLVGSVIGGAAQVISNVATGKQWSDGLAGAVAGGFVYGAIIIATEGNTAAAAYSSAFAESTVNEAADYLLHKKKPSKKNIKKSIDKVANETMINGTLYLGTGKASEKIIPTGKKWIKPKKIKTCFTGKYARKVSKQSITQASITSVAKYRINKISRNKGPMKAVKA